MIWGRDQEIEHVGRLLADARAGRSRVLVVSGEAGIGKTSLLAEATAMAGDLLVLRCSGTESDVVLGYSGLHQLLAPVLHHLSELPEAHAAALRGALGLSTDSAVDLFVRAAVLSLLSQAAEQRPLLVIVDNAQWVDSASMAALVFTAQRLEAEPIALLFAVREPECELLALADLPELRLPGLAPEDAVGLLREHGWTAPRPILDSLAEATGYNPLALTEASSAEDQIVNDLTMHATVPLGSRLRSAFTARIGSLPTDSQKLLLVAAADEVGSHHVVLGAARRLGIAAEALAAAEASGLLEVDVTGIRFRHPLNRSAVYQQASFHERATTHLAIADELSALGEDDRATWHRAVAATRPDEELAAALERNAEAIGRRGGTAAMVSVLRRSAELSTTATGRFRRLVAAGYAAWRSGQSELSRTLADQAVAEAADDVTTEVELARLRGLIELGSGDPAAAYAELMRSAQLAARTAPEQAANLLFLASDAAYHADRVDDALLAAELITTLDCPAEIGRNGRLLASAIRGRPVADHDQPRELLDLVAPYADPQDVARLHWTLALSWMGRHQRQAREFGRSVCERMQRAGMLGVLSTTLSWLTDVEFHLGLWLDAVAHAEDSARFARDAGQRSRLADSLAQLARLAAVRGEADECRRLAAQAIEIALPLRNRVATAMSAWALGLLDLAAGDAEPALERLAGLRTAGSPLAHQRVAQWAIGDIVEAAVRSGDFDYARQAVDEFAAWAAGTNLPWAHACLHRCRGLISEEETADEHFRRAMAVEGAADRPFDQARTALLYGEHLRRSRRPSDARRQLRAAAELFEAIGAEQWAELARVQLRGAGASAHRATASAAAKLTPQELQVAQLAANGLSNKEIGAQLFLSPRTVGYHLYKLFPKLGISARSHLRSVDLGDPVPIPAAE